PDGTITAGSASQISDGACAVVVMSRAKAEEIGASVLAEIGYHGVVAGPDASLQSQPSNAIKKALSRANLAVADLDLIEINEAFASVAIQSTRELGVDISKVNVKGGAIALGHPIGASGARIVLTLAEELRRRGGGTGAAAPVHPASASPRGRRRWSPRTAAGDAGLGCSRSIRPRRSPAALFSATACECRTMRRTMASTSGRWPAGVTSADCPGPRRKRS